MSDRYQVVIAHPSSVRYVTSTSPAPLSEADTPCRPRRVTYRETTSGGSSWQVDVYTRRSSQRVVYSNSDGDYERYSSSYRRRVYYY
ncbi:hypothetical protein HJFPF1_08145 [Paramyrothecium foliicola]|nr:hypothetical protein HJFPF1_08145 [Paramyrothecium foliicola]